MRFKLILLALFFTVFSQKMAAQIIVDGVNINDRADVEFIEVHLFNDVIGWAGKSHVDYGQQNDRRTRRPTKITEATGENVEFTSRMNALNHFFKNGWEPIFSDRIESTGAIMLRRRKV